MYYKTEETNRKDLSFILFFELYLGVFLIYFWTSIDQNISTELWTNA